MSRKEKRNLARICITLCAFAAVFIADKIVDLASVFSSSAGWGFPFALYGAIYLASGYDVLWRAARNIARGQVFDENFLMCVATLGAFALAIYRGCTGREIEGFDEACAVLLFYQVGEFFQSYATGKSRRSISSLMDIRPDYANLWKGGQTERVDPAEVAVGDEIVINPGEKIPLDGVVLSGQSSLDTRALTGESAPRQVQAGDAVVSGAVNVTGQLTVRVEKRFYDSTVSKILDLVENASSQKSKAENFITKFARVYTPAVVGIAVLLALVPSLITHDAATWIYRALSFLVVSCPCALVISIPLSFFAGMGAASRYGILVKGSGYLEQYHRAGVFVFDKTGTITRGNFAVCSVTPKENRDEILRLAAIAEQGASHPIALSIEQAWGKETEPGDTRTAVAGAGVVA
ncbi:MAG: HAD-IC family P-type ATPase, partial [Clostridiales bacterium]|nr:HAD-IC family P-type ATPase [Clostridiales bacterium]